MVRANRFFQPVPFQFASAARALTSSVHCLAPPRLRIRVLIVGLMLGQFRRTAARCSQRAATSEISDPLVASMEGIDTELKVKIQQPLTDIWKELRIVRDLAAAPQTAAKNHANAPWNGMTLADKIDEISNALWAVREQSFRLQRRFIKWADQDRSLRLQRHFNNRNGCASRKLISKQKEAPKDPTSKKGQPITPQGARGCAHFNLAREARAILKSEGYCGSLQMKKGMPVYNKMHQLRQHRLLATRDSDRGTSASPLPQQSRGASAVVEVIALNQDSIHDAPADGDQNQLRRHTEEA